jgi:hypothetical protein
LATARKQPSIRGLFRRPERHSERKKVCWTLAPLPKRGLVFWRDGSLGAEACLTMPRAGGSVRGGNSGRPKSVVMTSESDILTWQCDPGIPAPRRDCTREAPFWQIRGAFPFWPSAAPNDFTIVGRSTTTAGDFGPPHLVWPSATSYNELCDCRSPRRATCQHEIAL